MGQPDLSLESAHRGAVAGIDEAGRGPWAGPVVAAAVVLDLTQIPDGIDDSKRLKSAARDRLYTQIMLSARGCGVGIATVEEIDRLNILHASMLAMQRAFTALPFVPSLALVDGNRAPVLPCEARTIIAGDTLSLSIAAASIIAKVTRDRMMRELAHAYPDYGFDHNAGYGTPKHKEALHRLGVTPYHRKSFAPVRVVIEAHKMVVEAA